ncbi:hypothetical protein SAMN05421823_111230 [Catalinimonas alkaloidigena]|uniref:Oxygen tolerance n=1 Tax=Catalinimonas alkaloidigena TaxID=1075417 RepID=A0A1G9RS59_9BACT|nr:hypothetical protein [Catalinimonas alkaloidigena]SDM25335.1 hypothetical protein SAMN05421823_111230 [Catalinimonas alkaloidigena]
MNRFSPLLVRRTLLASLFLLLPFTGRTQAPPRDARIAPASAALSQAVRLQNPRLLRQGSSRTDSLRITDVDWQAYDSLTVYLWSDTLRLSADEPRWAELQAYILRLDTTSSCYFTFQDSVITVYAQGVETANPGVSAPSPAAVADAAEAELGHIAHNLLDSMEVGQPQQVRIYISRDALEAPSLFANIVGEVTRAEIEVSSLMSTKVYCPDDDPTNPKFAVTLTNEPALKPILGQDEVFWDWSVTPLRPGRFRLNITASIQVELDGEKYLREKEVYSSEIFIQAQPEAGFWTATLLKWRDGILHDPQWLLTVLLIPLGRWLYQKYGKKKAPQAEEQPTEPVS